jgi:lipid-A-disaccharide synthase
MAPKNPDHLLIVAGEASGDMHAAHLVQELKKQNPRLKFSGLGGQEMLKAGVEIYQDLTKIAVVGFVEVLKHYREFKKAFDLIVRKAEETKAQTVILVDYPGFNLRLAKKLKSKGLTVIYYISPQVWAWKENRVRTIKRNVDKMLVLFPFEVDFYKRHGMNVSFVGHPLTDYAVSHTSKEDYLKHNTKLQEYRYTIGLLPGSRPKEIEQMLPVMRGAAEILVKKYPMMQFLLIKAPTIARSDLEKIMQSTHITYDTVEDKRYDAIHACDTCIVTSGTATLETGLLGKPMVIVYKTSFFTWCLAKWLVKLPYIGLINIVAGKKIVPECVQFDARPEKIAAELETIFKDEIQIARIKSDLYRAKKALGEGNALQRAAEVILRTIS